MNDRNNREIINYASKKPVPLDKSKKMNEMMIETSRQKGTLEININEILTSSNFFVNTFNTAKYANKQQFKFNPILKTNFLRNTPNNKLSDFIIPIECKGDDGEIPDIEPLYFEKNKITLTKKHGVNSKISKQKAISLHLNREFKEGVGSPLISDEYDPDSVGQLKKSKNFIQLIRI